MQASVHRRSVVIDSDGIATVEVDLEEVHTAEPLVLATIAEPFTGYDFDAWAVTSDDEQVPVEAVMLRRGAVAAVLRPQHRDFASLHWSFRVSNAYPLIQRDLVVPAEGFYQAGSKSRAMRSCVLRISSKVLWQSVRFEIAQVMSPRLRARAVVEKKEPLWHGLGHRWVEVGGERELERAERALLVRHDVPVVEHRYAIAFPPFAESGQAADESEWKRVKPLLEEVAALRSSSDSGAEVLQRTLRDHLTSELRDQYGAEPATPLTFTCAGMLWEPAKKQLLMAYGDCPLDHWGHGFAYGQGVAGHSFRFGKVATYHTGANPSLIYQKRPGYHEYAWIVSVPLQFRSTCVGVVCFSGSVHPRLKDFVGEQLRSLTRATAELAEEEKRQLGVLTYRVNCSFWNTLAQSPQLPTSHRKLALSALQGITEPPTPELVAISPRRPPVVVAAARREQEPPQSPPPRATVPPALESQTRPLLHRAEAGASPAEKPPATSISPPPDHARPSEASTTKLGLWLTLAGVVVTAAGGLGVAVVSRPSPATEQAAAPDISTQTGLRELLRTPGGVASLRELRAASTQLVSLYRIDLSEFSLHRVALHDADLTCANLRNADLTDSDLTNAKLDRADLHGARLSGATLKSASFIGADVSGVDMRGADLEAVSLSGEDWSQVSGLTQVQLDRACGDAATKLPPGLKLTTCSPN